MKAWMATFVPEWLLPEVVEKMYLDDDTDTYIFEYTTDRIAFTNAGDWINFPQNTFTIDPLPPLNSPAFSIGWFGETPPREGHFAGGEWEVDQPEIPRRTPWAWEE